MFTQCSNCETVFKLSAEVLRAAGGQVRCGRCGEVFSALARLAEDPSAFAARETQLDLEERADSILESARNAPPAPASPPASAPAEIKELEFGDGPEVAHLQILNFSSEELARATGEPVSAKPAAAAPAAETAVDDVLGENSMEFTLPPGELDRIFVESKRRTQAVPPFALRPETPPKAPQKSPASVNQPTPVPRRPEPVAPNPVVPHSNPAAGGAAEAADDGPLPDIEVVRDNRSGNMGGGGPMISDFARRQLQASVDPAEFDLGKKASPLGNSFKLWLMAAIAAALLLAGQVVHHNRAWLTAQGPLAPLLRSLYATLGSPVSTPANLGAYQLRQWGVTGDPSAGGTLKVRASILNTTAQLVPFPLLRVTLANRYGSRIGARDFEAGEYLGKPTVRLLAPGERVDATLQIQDPGKDAEGFEIDVCLRGADQKIVCANDIAAPQAKS